RARGLDAGCRRGHLRTHRDRRRRHARQRDSRRLPDVAQDHDRVTYARLTARRAARVTFRRMRSILIAVLAFQLGHLSAPSPAAPTSVVVMPAAPVVVEKPAPAPPTTLVRYIGPCTCNGTPCTYCGGPIIMP